MDNKKTFSLKQIIGLFLIITSVLVFILIYPNALEIVKPHAVTVIAR